MANSPLTGPFDFIPTNHHADMLQAEASAFIAQRLAGVEWQLMQLNKNLFDLINKGIAQRAP